MKDKPLETSLVLRAQSRKDEKAFSRLVSLHQGKVRGLLLRLTQQSAAADDLAQDTFLIAYKKLHTYQGKGEFGGWLCTIAYRCFLRYYRQQKKQAAFSQQLLEEERNTVSTIENDYFDTISNAQIALEQAMGQLSQEQAAAITLCETYGYSHNEAANILDLPLGTLKSHVNRGKQKLRLLLQTNTKRYAHER